jgi:hypothetical protein
MLLYQIKNGQLVSLSYQTDNKIYDLSYLKSTPVWDTLASLIRERKRNAANKLFKRALSMAMCKNWARMKSGHWYLQYAGHIFCVRSDGPVQVSLERENPKSRVPTDLAMKAAEIAYYIRRHWHAERVAQRTAARDMYRDYRSYQTHRTRRTYHSYRTR